MATGTEQVNKRVSIIYLPHCKKKKKKKSSITTHQELCLKGFSILFDVMEPSLGAKGFSRPGRDILIFPSSVGN